MKNILSIAAVSGVMCILLGAFGAHGLKPLLSSEMLAAYETGVRYQFYHTLVLILIAVLYHQQNNPKFKRAASFFYAGVLLFSGSLYLLAFTSIQNHTWHWVGLITPVGGVCFVVGWVYLFLASKTFQ
jgi:uncharacterized membrane protein YgdD (TMEM256/DUF423 family)